MILKYTCSKCKHDNNFKPVEATRGDLQMRLGVIETKVKCEKCNHEELKHINDIRAYDSSLKIVLAWVAGGLAAMILWFLYGAIAVVPIVIPLIVWYQEMNATRNFNSYKIRR